MTNAAIEALPQPTHHELSMWTPTSSTTIQTYWGLFMPA